MNKIKDLCAEIEIVLTGFAESFEMNKAYFISFGVVSFIIGAILF